MHPCLQTLCSMQVQCNIIAPGLPQLRPGPLTRKLGANVMAWYGGVASEAGRPVPSNAGNEDDCPGGADDDGHEGDCWAVGQVSAVNTQWQLVVL